MQVKILGGHGGISLGFQATSFLIDNNLLIDAGSVASTLSISAQAQIEHILISHAHLDHIKDLAFLCDNCFGLRSSPFEVFSHQTVIKIIKDHLFNDLVWPDFSILPNKENPTMRFHPLKPEELIHLGDYKIIAVPVKHPSDAMGFIIEKGEKAILFTQDTGSTDRIWEVAKNYKNLKAIFTEVSFPNKLQNVATISDHHTPSTLAREVAKMPKEIPIILTHLKPNFKDELRAEINALSNPRITLLDSDGESFYF